MKSILLVRHAEAEHHVQEITGGWTDTSLTEHGQQQARLLAARLQRELDGIPVELCTSNLRRAVQTAELIGRALQIEPFIFTEITDLNNGIAAGLTHVEARQVALPYSEPGVDWQPYPGAESWRQFFQRVAGFIDDFHARQTRTALLVTHAATVHVIVGWWLGVPLESPTHFGAAPASISVLTYNRWQERSLERLNDTSHLFRDGLADPIDLSSTL
jgi:probable phosphoglycerate mutase